MQPTRLHPSTFAGNPFPIVGALAPVPLRPVPGRVGSVGLAALTFKQLYSYEHVPISTDEESDQRVGCDVKKTTEGRREEKLT